MRPTISPATKTATIANIEHAVEARADAAEDDLAELHQPHRHEAAERREGVVHRVDRAVRGRGRRGRPERGVGDAEAHLLALHVAARLQRARGLVDAERGEARVAGLLGHDARRAAARRRSTVIAAEQRPALARVAAPSSPNVKQSAAGISRIASTSRKFESGVGFSNGCAELTLKKPPPFVPSCLIAICEAAGPSGDHLLGRPALAPSRVLSVGCRRSWHAACVGAEGLHDALRDEDEREDERERQQDVERARASGRPRSCRSCRPSARAKPRISATSTAMPVAAETKFCTVEAEHLRQVAHRRSRRRSPASSCWWRS